MRHAPHPAHVPQEEAPLVVDYKDFSADGVHFQLQLVPDRVPDLLAAGAHAKLKLVTRISTGVRLYDVLASASVIPV
jgi:hypothetical protein